MLWSSYCFYFVRSFCCQIWLFYTEASNLHCSVIGYCGVMRRADCILGKIRGSVCKCIVWYIGIISRDYETAMELCMLLLPENLHSGSEVYGKQPNPHMLSPGRVAPTAGRVAPSAGGYALPAGAGYGYPHPSYSKRVAVSSRTPFTDLSNCYR